MTYSPRVQAVFKDTRDSLLRLGIMRFADYIVTERPMPPSTALLHSNRRHSLAFRYGVDAESQSDDAKSSIVSLPSLHIDSRRSTGDLSAFQTTPSGNSNLQFSLSQDLTFHSRSQATPPVKLPCSSSCSTRKPSRAQLPVP